MRVALLIRDCGDGSCTTDWFKDILLADEVANNDMFCEDYGMNEGSAEIVEIVDGWEPCGGFSDQYYAAKLGWVAV